MLPEWGAKLTKTTPVVKNSAQNGSQCNVHSRSREVSCGQNPRPLFPCSRTHLSPYTHRDYMGVSPCHPPKGRQEDDGKLQTRINTPTRTNAGKKSLIQIAKPQPKINAEHDKTPRAFPFFFQEGEGRQLGRLKPPPAIK